MHTRKRDGIPPYRYLHTQPPIDSLCLEAEVINSCKDNPDNGMGGKEGSVRSREKLGDEYSPFNVPQMQKNGCFVFARQKHSSRLAFRNILLHNINRATSLQKFNAILKSL